MQIFNFLDSVFFLSMTIFNISFLILVAFFIWGAIQTEKIRRIVFRLGNNEINSSDVVELIALLEMHEVPLRFYARNLLRSAHKLVEINGDKIDPELGIKLQKSILRRGIVI